VQQLLTGCALKRCREFVTRCRTNWEAVCWT